MCRLRYFSHFGFSSRESCESNNVILDQRWIDFGRGKHSQNSFESIFLDQLNTIYVVGLAIQYQYVNVRQDDEAHHHLSNLDAELE